MNCFTSYVGDNSVIVREAIDLYVKDGQNVADVTFGKGVFWRKVDTDKFNFFPSDMRTLPDKPYDFRHLPYEDGMMDVVVFDPPYAHNPGNMMVEDSYQNSSTAGMYHDDILKLYEDGMVEGVRVLKSGGQLWVKCKDELESSIQRWSHIEILLMANKMGLYAKDLFVLTQKAPALIQHKQKHARKNHSYLWIFEKCDGGKPLAVQRAALNCVHDARKASPKG